MSEDMTEQYDVFVSYKSDDANEVRGVVELLMASGIRAWFAEYQILTHSWDDFQDAIDRGIAASHWAIVFTNRRWGASRHCCNEMEHIVTKGAGAILEVRMAEDPLPSERFPILEEVRRTGRSMNWGARIDDVVAFLESHTGLNARQSAPADYTDVPGRDDVPIELPFGVTLRPGQLAPNLGSGPFALQTPSFAEGAQLIGEIEGYRVYLAVTIEPFETEIQSRRGFRLSSEPTMLSIMDRFDDREAYDKYRTIAKNWFVGKEAGEIGLHLFLWNDRGHFAVTFHDLSGANAEAEVWRRKYVLTLETPDDSERGEAELLFSVELPRNAETPAAQSFARLAPHFDRIVSTVTYWPRPGLALQEYVVTVLLLLYTLVFWHGISGFRQWYPPVQAIPEAIFRPIHYALVAWLSGTTAYLLVSSNARRCALKVAYKWSTHMHAIGNMVASGVAGLPISGHQLFGLTMGGLRWAGHVLDEGYPAAFLYVVLGSFLKIIDPLYWGTIVFISCCVGSAKVVAKFAIPLRVRLYVPGMPRFRFNGNLQRISPRLCEVLGTQRHQATRTWWFLLGVWHACFAIAFPLLVAGHEIWASVILGIATVSCSAMLLLPILPFAPLVLHGNAWSEEFATEAARSLMRWAEGGQWSAMVLAMQWAAAACEEDPDDPRSLGLLSKSATEVLATAGSPDATHDDTSTHQLAEVARDVLGRTWTSILDSSSRDTEEILTLLAGITTVVDFCTHCMMEEAGSAEQRKKCESTTQQMLAIVEEVRRRYPEEAEYARGLSVIYRRLGDVNQRLKDTERANQRYEQSLRLLEELRLQDPGNAEVAHDLVLTHYKLAELHKVSGERRQSEQHLSECHRTLKDMLKCEMFLDEQLVQIREHLQRTFGGE